MKFSVDDDRGKGAKMSTITDRKIEPVAFPSATERQAPALLRGPTPSQAEPTQDYYKKVVAATFRGDLQAARQKARLFMAPGMGHCGGGPGAGEADPLKPLADWVENGVAPDYIVAEHRTNGIVDNQRRVCAYPQRAVYIGTAGGQNDPANWIERNFACRKVDPLGIDRR